MAASRSPPSCVRWAAGRPPFRLRGLRRHRAGGIAASHHLWLPASRKPTWPLAERLPAIGLPPLSPTEGAAVHIHQHLDLYLYVDGRHPRRVAHRAHLHPRAVLRRGGYGSPPAALAATAPAAAGSCPPPSRPPSGSHAACRGACDRRGWGHAGPPPETGCSAGEVGAVIGVEQVQLVGVEPQLALQVAVSRAALTASCSTWRRRSPVQGTIQPASENSASQTTSRPRMSSELSSAALRRTSCSRWSSAADGSSWI
jgi:hypothetical protein